VYAAHIAATAIPGISKSAPFANRTRFGNADASMSPDKTSATPL
jgi:hypothetical protein